MLSLRKLLFLQYILIGQWFAWSLIWLLGRLHIWRCLFVIYPHDFTEYRDVIPDWTWIRQYMSGRPLPGGFIFDAYRPIGIYFYISDDLKSLRKKKNRCVATNIQQRMRLFLKISKAKSCGFAGQLGVIMEKRHDIPMVDPFYTSTNGNIYTLTSTITSLQRCKIK